jgi:hypothetical protein
MGFREHSTLELLSALENKPDGLCLLLLMEQQEPWVLLTQGYQFPWCFRVKVAGHVEAGNVKL